MLVIKPDSKIKSPEGIFFILIFTVLFLTLAVIFYQIQSSLSLIFILFLLMIVSLLTIALPRIILSDSGLIIKANWPTRGRRSSLTRWSKTYKFEINNIKKIIIARTKDLHEFLGQNDNFKKIMEDSRMNFKERLFQEIKFNDYDAAVASRIWLSGENTLWFCVLGNQGDLKMFLMESLEEKKTEMESLRSELLKNNIEVIYKF